MYTAGRRGQATLISLTMTDCHDQGPSFCTLPGNRDLPHRDAPLATPRLGRASLHSHRQGRYSALFASGYGSHC